MMYAMPVEPWKVQDEYFNRIRNPSDKLKFLLNYAVLAPSIYNTQPWVFKVTGSEVAMYIDRARSLPVGDPVGRSLVMSCGAALFNLKIAARHFGHEPVIRTFPDLDIADLLAFVRLGAQREATAEEHRLFAALKMRRTVRSAFRPVAVRPELLRRLQAAAEAEGARLHDVQEVNQQRALIEIIREARQIRNGDQRFIRERDLWTHSRREYGASPGWTRGVLLEGIVESPKAAGLRGLDRDQIQPYEEELKGSGPVFVVLSTSSDTLPAWLSAGHALSRVLLTAAYDGLNAAFLGYPVGIGPLRERIGALTGGRGHPQMLLRIGYGVPGRPTRRQPVTHVACDG